MLRLSKSVAIEGRTPEDAMTTLRARRWMLLLLSLAACGPVNPLGSSGSEAGFSSRPSGESADSNPSTGPDSKWVLVLDGANIDSQAPLCWNGLPDARALVKVDGAVHATPTFIRSLAPAWKAPVASATERDYEKGITVGVFTSCDGGTPWKAGVVIRHDRPLQSVSHQSC
jgi:hypothetical protein